MQRAKVYFELFVLGATVKVTAIDADSGCEASIVGPATLPRAILEQAAIRKLEYVEKKRRGET
jgi:hypothetical protein